MHEVTIIASLAVAITFKRATLTLAKISDGREEGTNLTAVKPTTTNSEQGSLCGMFRTKLDICVTGKMIGEILTNMNGIYLTMLRHFIVDIEVEIIKVSAYDIRRDLRRRKLLCCCCGDDLVWGDVKVLKENGLAEKRTIVDARAAIAMSTSADLDVEGAVDLVLLGAIDGHQVLSHGARNEKQKVGTATGGGNGVDVQVQNTRCAEGELHG